MSQGRVAPFALKGLLSLVLGQVSCPLVAMVLFFASCSPENTAGGGEPEPGVARSSIDERTGVRQPSSSNLPPASRPQDAPMWSAEIDLRIGSVDDPEYALTRVNAIEVALDGTIYTLHAGERVVRRFDDDGSFLGSMGGPGDGPGEFRVPMYMGWVADTLWVLDLAATRFTLFSSAGAFVSDFMVPIVMAADPYSVSPPRPIGLVPDGSVLGQTARALPQVADGQVNELMTVIMTRDGKVTDTLPPLPIAGQSWTVSAPGGLNPGRPILGLGRGQPFSDAPVWRFGPGETALVIVDQAIPSPSEEPAFRVSKLTFAGDTLFSRDYAFERVPLEPSDIELVLDDVAPIVERAFDLTPARAREWASLTLYQPAYKPAVQSMALGRDGTIWLLTGSDGGGEDGWLILDAAGEPIGRVNLPEGLELFVVDPPHIWGSLTGDFDVPYVLRIRIAAPEAS